MKRLLGLLPVLGLLACSPDTDAPMGDSHRETLRALASASAAAGPNVFTNKDDYVPGEMVLMVGSGFEPGEVVRLTLTETPELHDDREFTVVVDSAGGFWFDEFRPEPHHVGVSFVLTALGETSGRQAQTTFTDAIVPGSSSKNHNGDPGVAELTMARPTTTVTGNLLIAQVTIEGLGETEVICTPTGWNSIFRTNNSSSTAQQIFYRVADATDIVSSTYTWRFRTGSASCGGSSNQVTGKGAVGGIIAYSGVDVGHANGPIFGWSGGTGSSNTIVAPITVNDPTTVPTTDAIPAGSRVVRYFGNDKEFQISSSGTGTSEVYFTRRNKQGGGFEKPSGQAADGDQASTGNPTAVTGSNSGNGGNWVAQTVAIRAAVVLPSISINDVTAAEGTAMATTPFTFTVTLSAPSAQTVTATWATAAGTTNPATGGNDCVGNDYVTNGGTVTFAPTVTSQQVTVQVCADLVDELNETFFVNLSNPANATIADNQGLGTITDDDAAPTLSIGDVSANEGNAGTTNFDFTVTLSAASSQAVTVNFATANGTTNPATGGASCPGVDYESQASGSLMIPAGQTSGTITIEVCGDLLDEVDETFFVNLSSPSNATIADNQGLGTITDDDAAPTVSIGDQTVTEGDAGTTNAVFTVSLSAASSQTVTVNFATANGTTNPATGGACGGAGVDYVTQNGTVTFTAGDVSEDVTIAVCGDLLDEANETFFVNLSSPSNATINDGQGLGTITDDDAAPTVSIGDQTVTEGDAGTVNATFTVSLSAASSQTVTVNFATANGTTNPATGGACGGAGVDYETQNGTVTFNAGDVSEDVTIAVCGDLLDEANETFFVNLTTPSNATISDPQGLGTITDDDDAPTVSIGNQTVAEGDAGTVNATFTVSLSAASSQTVTVSFATANGTTNPATGGAACGAGVDYETQNGTVTFDPEDMSETVTIVVCGDLLDEANETFFVNLSTPSNATISDGQGLGTITDDDAAPTLSIGDVTANEGNAGTTDFDFTVTLSAASGQAVEVSYATANGTTNPATGGGACGAGVDYETPVGGSLSIPAGQTSGTITIKVCGDAVNEANETFFVNLSSPSNATINDGQGLGTITNDDTPADQLGPITSNVLVAPIPIGLPGLVTANVDDATTGNSKIKSAEFSIDGGGWTGMTAQDGGFDEVNENVTGTIPLSSVTGVFQVCVRGYDEYDNQGNTECFLYAVYDPSAGFVTGGGWINSPLNAYPAEPALTGRANFGFVSKYKKGATTPDGSTEFQFQVANLNFHSTSYQWLVVTAGAAPRAQFKGTGRLNGVDGYNFLITAVDGGKTSPDAFRIKITLGSTVIYDNQPGAGESTALATELGGGSIVVHSK